MNSNAVEVVFNRKTPTCDVVDTMFEVVLVGDQEQTFYKVRETLKRMGIPSYSKDNKNALYQSCHILHKKGRYYICHFKQLLALDGYPSKLSFEDIDRLILIVHYLQEWNLVKVADAYVEDIFLTTKNNVKLKIIKHSDKQNWNLISKHNIAEKKHVE